MQNPCPDCGAPIFWVTLKDSDRRIPLDPNESMEGTYRLLAEVPGEAEEAVPPDRPGYTNHWDTCPKR